MVSKQVLFAGGEQSKVVGVLMERVTRKLRQWCLAAMSKLVLFAGGAYLVVVNNLRSQVW